MKHQDPDSKFSWSLFLSVTGLSFLAFCYFLKVLNNYYPPAFLWVGISALAAGALSAIVGTFINS